MTATTIALPDDVVAWIEDVAGGRVTHADRKPGGNRKEAWFVDVERGDGSVAELFLRYDRSDPAATKDPWTLHREAEVYLALQDTDVPVPRVLRVHADHQAMLSERLTGENWFSRIVDPAEQVATAKEFITILAALHRLDPRTVDLPSAPVPPTIAAAVHRELDEMEGVVTARGGDPDPALSFSLRWLRDNVPDHDGPVVLVQGDTGPGNFMYAGGRVLAVVDWELAHFGDPMDDIAWLSLRATQEPFTDLPARLREYEQLSGHTVDDGRLRYYRVMAETKLQVMGHRPGGMAARYADTEGGGGDIGNGLIYGVLHRRLWLEALADAVGIELTPAEEPPAHPPSEHHWFYGALLGQLRDVVVPRIGDPLARTRTKGFARVVKYLEQVDADGAFFAERELDDLAALLGTRPASVPEGRAAAARAARSGKLDDAEYLGCLWRRVARENELARPAMGVLADRHWPPVR